MKNKRSGLTKNLILTGVGGQGNVLASRGSVVPMLVDQLHAVGDHDHRVDRRRGVRQSRGLRPVQFPLD